VFSGMIASTCLAVFFVPSFYVVVRRFEEWRLARKSAKWRLPPPLQHNETLPMSEHLQTEQ
jgi:hypothetical protein